VRQIITAPELHGVQEAAGSNPAKAAEMLAKICGWNEPERFNVQRTELKVDAALLEELRKGAHAMNALGGSRAKLIGAPVVAQVADTPATPPLPVPPLP
jgi:hypothetical protein